ncbi:glycosyltransferase [Limosilactobacillus sp.]|uniref:glycosyltransferase n=1 Tax=Limosilactobacillus sp. TaxID=2773925 RepID=UPI0035A038B8
MISFITSRQDMLTSAIELAQAQRLKIFDALKQPAQIVTLQYNFAHYGVEKKLGVVGRVINLFQYYQRLPYNYLAAGDQQIIAQIVNQPGFDYHAQDNQVYYQGKLRIRLNYNDHRLYNVDYLDKFGFTDRRDYYDCGCLSYTEFFEDKGRIVTRQYYDHFGKPKIVYHYRGGKGNTPVFTMIELYDQGRKWQLDSVDELRAHFLDELVANDPHAALISDRSDYALKAMGMMKNQVPRYQVFHSVFTEDGNPKGKLFGVYKPLTSMYQKGTLNGLISATTHEAQDAATRFQISHSYGIPVTYLDDAQLTKKIPFTQRHRGQIIAVARLTSVKRLDHLIDTVILLKKKYPEVDLKIYGFDDSWSNYATSNHLKTLVRNRQASDYIHFCGYRHDLTSVYETADVEVLTSQYEGFAMALLEAQGHGCPAVSYDINYGPSEIIDDGVSGKLLPAGDMHSLYVALEELLQNRDQLQQYAAHAQQAATKFSFEKVAAKWRDFLSKEKLLVD